MAKAPPDMSGPKWNDSPLRSDLKSLGHTNGCTCLPCRAGAELERLNSLITTMHLGSWDRLRQSEQLKAEPDAGEGA